MNSLFVAWRPGESGSGWRPVGRLTFEAGLYVYSYTRGATQHDFCPFAGMDDLEATYESESLFPIFANRLLSASRPEYEEYLQWSGFDPAVPPEPLVVLGVTEGIRKTDAVEVFPYPTSDSEGCYRNRFFLHGIRWLDTPELEQIGSLQPGDELALMLEEENLFDPNAVAVHTSSSTHPRIGYVPRYLARDVRALARQCGLDAVRIEVERVNRQAPTQNRLLCRMRSCWPEGFQPCSGDEFLPIQASFPAACD